jgi:hypothetical protein
MTLDIVRHEGIRGLYRGLSASYLGVSEGVIQWVLYEVSGPIEPRASAGTCLLRNGLVSWSLTYNLAIQTNRQDNLPSPRRASPLALLHRLDCGRLGRSQGSRIPPDIPTRSHSHSTSTTRRAWREEVHRSAPDTEARAGGGGRACSVRRAHRAHVQGRAQRGVHVLDLRGRRGEAGVVDRSEDHGGIDHGRVGRIGRIG